jgi:hypothetical protein
MSTSKRKRTRKGNGKDRPTTAPSEVLHAVADAIEAMDHLAVCPALVVHRAIADMMKPVIVAHGLEEGAAEVLRPMSELLHMFADMILLRDPGPLMLAVVDKMREVPHGEWTKGKEGKEMTYTTDHEEPAAGERPLPDRDHVARIAGAVSISLELAERLDVLCAGLADLERADEMPYGLTASWPEVKRLMPEGGLAAERYSV